MPASPSRTAPPLWCAPWKSSPAWSPPARRQGRFPPDFSCCGRIRQRPQGPRMTEGNPTVIELRRQQAAIAGFGSFALQQSDLLTILTEAARVCAQGLDVSFSKICRYREVENDLLIEAGYGWNAGVIG